MKNEFIEKLKELLTQYDAEIAYNGCDDMVIRVDNDIYYLDCSYIDSTNIDEIH